MRPKPQPGMVPLLVGTVDARWLLGWSETKFAYARRHDPDFPKPWPGSPANKPQWQYANWVAYVRNKKTPVPSCSNARSRPGQTGR